ncbi:MAG: DUF1573 domain-containing protein [Saprospiraceae bacterium]|nr:DUF1573 domain-containing protein [Saprospiraceae bacterium]
MKKLGFLFALAMVAMVACKNDATTAEEPQLTATPPTTAANVNTPVPTANPLPDSEPAVPAGPITTISFDEMEYDFGMVMEGEKVVHEYSFTNTGDEPLIISNAKGSCGCTVPDWPREPIAPGESNVIKVQFDSKNKGKVGGGLQSKRVTITANTDPVNTYLTIKGKVDKKEEAANTPS